MLDIGEDAWRAMLDVILTGVWHTCCAGAQHLIARGAGAMIVTNSIAGLRGLVGVAHYATAKHGVVGLMQILAKGLAPHNIQVNCGHPTDVDTPLIQNDAVRGAFRPDSDRPPTRAEFAEAARIMNKYRFRVRQTVGGRRIQCGPDRPQAGIVAAHRAGVPRNRGRRFRKARRRVHCSRSEIPRPAGRAGSGATATGTPARCSRTPPWPRSSPSARTWGRCAVRRWGWCASG